MSNLGKLDVDYLFDNFEEFCEVEFRKNQEKIKQPSVVRNLCSLFDKVAMERPVHIQGEQKSINKGHSSNKERSVKVLTEKSREKRPKEVGKEKLAIKKKLKLNLQDVFHTSSIMKASNTIQTSKTKGLKTLCADSSLLKFMKAKGDLIKKTYELKKSQTREKKSRSKSKGQQKFKAPKLVHQSVQEPVLSKSKDAKKAAKLMENCYVKQILCSAEVQPPPTGSTRLQTVTSRNGSNKRSTSFMETDNKIRNQSCRNLRADSFMANAHINSMLNNSKNLQTRLMKKAGDCRQQSQAGFSITQGSQKLFSKMQTITKQRRESAAKKPSDTKSKYYIPAHIGINKGHKYGNHNSFAHSEDHSKDGHSSYMNRVLFPKMMSKILSGEDIKTGHPGKQLKASKSSRCLG